VECLGAGRLRITDAVGLDGEVWRVDLTNRVGCAGDAEP
jgi:hypothetical protein